MHPDLSWARRTVGPPLLITAVAGGLAALQPGGATVTVLTAAFLVLAPATVAAALLRNVDLLSRIAVGAGTAIAVDTVVAQTMLSVGAWSVRGGVLAVGLLSALALALVPVPSGRRATPPVPPAGTPVPSDEPAGAA